MNWNGSTASTILWRRCCANVARARDHRRGQRLSRRISRAPPVTVRVAHHADREPGEPRLRRRQQPWHPRRQGRVCRAAEQRRGGRAGWVARWWGPPRPTRRSACAPRILVLGSKGLIDSAGLLMSADGIGRGRGRLERWRAVREPDDAHAERVRGSVPAGDARRRRALRRGLLCVLRGHPIWGFAGGWRGGSAATCTGAVVHHAYSRSTAPYSAFKAFHVERNRCFWC